MEEDGEGIDLDGVREGEDGAFVQIYGDVLEVARGSGEDGGEDGEPAEWFAGFARREERLGEHDEHAGDGEDDFREQGQGVGVHQ